MIKNLFAALAAVLLLAGAARAEHADKDKAMQGKSKEAPRDIEACKPDQEKFCKDVEPGEGRILKCLHENKDKISKACGALMAKKKGEFMEKHAKLAQAMEACKADKDKFCKDVEPGEGRIADCIKSHEKDLSSGCRELLERKHREKGGDHKEKSQK